jgi:hypothetical protein
VGHANFASRALSEDGSVMGQQSLSAAIGRWSYLVLGLC